MQYSVFSCTWAGLGGNESTEVEPQPETKKVHDEVLLLLQVKKEVLQYFKSRMYMMIDEGLLLLQVKKEVLQYFTSCM